MIMMVFCREEGRGGEGERRGVSEKGEGSEGEVHQQRYRVSYRASCVNTSLRLAYHWNVDRPQFSTQLGIDLQRKGGIQQDKHTTPTPPHPNPAHL